MKNQLTLLFVLISTSFVWSQNSCSKFYPFSEGVTSQITTYNKKGDVAAIVNYKVTNVSSNGSAETATMFSTIEDHKGERIAETTYDVTCRDNVVSIDFKSMMNPQIFEQFGEMKYDISGTNIDLPNDLSVGQSLPDADMKMKIDMGGINMNMNVAMKDRNVVGKESVTTPAGTFECFVITYTSEVKMGMNQTGTAKQWIAEGVGMVKQEDYNNKGKVMSSSLLTSFSK
ncbi:hypothetical protein [Altibacter sp.]|uniref:TapB family protein n=1 Tax=Altibacter sp. TaxID=2024823 RepID=UPI000C8CA060|nr:hypothetical protein [Altibacter sp.]MAP54517.1 hypothetical protein [Altibacter sp.]